MKDPINPNHYFSESGIQCIDVVRHLNFNRGNAIKYIWRAGLKDQSKTIEDLEKAKWYINDEIQRLSDEAQVDNTGDVYEAFKKEAKHCHGVNIKYIAKMSSDVDQDGDLISLYLVIDDNYNMLGGIYNEDNLSYGVFNTFENASGCFNARTSEVVQEEKEESEYNPKNYAQEDEEEDIPDSDIENHLPDEYEELKGFILSHATHPFTNVAIIDEIIYSNRKTIICLLTDDKGNLAGAVSNGLTTAVLSYEDAQTLFSSMQEDIKEEEEDDEELDKSSEESIKEIVKDIKELIDEIFPDEENEK